MATPRGIPIEQFYAEEAEEEWQRLDQDAYYRLEYDTTMWALARHLPERACILDAGGGPGRYSIALAKMGHNVTLFDLTPELLEVARREAARAGVLGRIAIAQGTITNLSRYPDGAFDVTLCLGGPLSHLREADARAQAVSELRRVTRTGGTVAASVMGLFAVLAETVRYWPLEIADKEPERWRNFYLNGNDERFVGRTYCHFYRPEEFTTLVADAGLEILECVGLEGLSTAFWDEVAALAVESPAKYALWMEQHYHYASHPVVFGASNHMLVVARK